MDGRRRAVLGFSGGTDSSAAARFLMADGWEVVAVTLDMTCDENLIVSARERAAALCIELIVENVRALFRREVIDCFISEYASGRTPAPCTRCNSRVKWHALASVADRLGIRHIATGHYFNIRRRNGLFYVSTALDTAKDQSYYLWGVPQEVLSRTLTPMGGRIKASIGERRKESMGICFLRGESYVDFLCREGMGGVRGEIVDRNGAVIGFHEGVGRYTIGQKRGVPGVVVSIDTERNRIVVGSGDELYHRHLILADCMVVDMKELLSSSDIRIKVRGYGNNPPGAWRAEMAGERMLLTSDEPAWAVARGQPVVMYRGDTVIGGGILDDYY